jgi:DNA-binding SARP family transcriptional activator/tetratricopeptide (TPR) repeat protein
MLEIEFCLLGPLLVRRDGVAVQVPTGMQRSLLAALLLKANTAVPVEELADVLWGSEPPRSARASLQNVVMRLRRSLADAGRPRITAEPGGYQIRVEPGELDTDSFAARLASARDASRAGAHADAAARLRAALALWRGEPLAGVPSELLKMRAIPRLEEMRLQAVEARIEADMYLGRSAEVIIELRQLVAASPLRERLHTLLMLALYEDGQQAEALAAYRSVRRVLVRELGVEPGPELRRAQQQILAGHPAVHSGKSCGGSAAAPGSTGPERGQPDAVVARQLPGAVTHFAGRTAELAELVGMLDRAGGPIVISGTAGIGKTTLALHWAHQLADRFPDGQLYVNLQGFGPSGEPVAPAEAVRLFLNGLGVARDRIPVDLDAQEALYRSLLAGKRVLIVLDNARDPAQLRPLLPGSPACLVLVTSRNQLTGLAVANGAQVLTLDVLSEPEALEMTTLRLAPGLARAEPEAVAELIKLCARLPLAVSIAAARASTRPGPLVALVAELRDARARLDALGTGDVATDLRSVLSWSFQQLSPLTARMFRLLGLHPGPDFTIPAAASLAGVPLSAARQELADLARVHLISEHRPGRYAFHDLLRAYASEQAHLHDSDTDRRAALHRILDHYLHTTCAASLLLCFRIPITLSPLRPGTAPEELTDSGQALAWVEAEREVLLAAARLAAVSGFGVHAWQLPWTMAAFLDQLGYWHELAATQESAVAAAEQLGDLAGQAEAHRHLARGRIRLGEDAMAITHLTAAIELATQAGDYLMQATAHHDLGGVLESQGRVGDALAQAELARTLYHKAGHRWGEANALSALGWSHSQLGNYQQALDFCGQAMVIFRDLDIRLSQSATLDSLGYAHHQLGQYAEAIVCYREAIGIDGGAGDRRVRAEVLIHLGDSLQAAGHQEQAREAWLEALAILEALPQPETERVQSRLGELGPTVFRSATSAPG